MILIGNICEVIVVEEERLNYSEFDETLIEYFMECAGDDRANYENETTAEWLMDNPEKRKLGTAIKSDINDVKDIHKKQYTQYLQLKYTYFLLREKNCDDDLIMEKLRVPKKYIENFKHIFSHLSDKFRELTAIAYLLRYNQMGEAAVEFWYNEIDEFKEWAKLVVSNEDQYDFPDMGKHTRDKFLNVDTKKIDNMKRQAVKNFDRLFENEIYDKKEYIKAFIQIIAENMQAGLVDYLVVDNIDNKQIISFFVVSDDEINKREEQAPEIRKEEEYKKGVGITGSILVPNICIPHMHVGTNKLVKDSRQSVKHESVYSKVYKQQTDNFWLFPLFDDENNIYAAFRVINKKEDAVCQYWTYEERAVLIKIAEWFQSFWKLMEVMLDSLVRYVGIVDENKKAAKMIINKLQINDLLDEERLSVILAHLASVIHRKIESKAMKVLFLISKNHCVDELHRTFPEYPMQRWMSNYIKKEVIIPDTLEKISLSYMSVNPYIASYLFSSDGFFHGIRQLTNSDENEGISILNERMTGRDEFIAFLAEGKKQCIRIYYKGKLVSDYYLSESNGQWRLRFLNDFNDILKQTCIKTDICDVVCNIIFDLSYRKIGSMLIFNAEKLDEDKDLDKEFEYLKGATIQGERLSIIRDWASLDGAILMKKTGDIFSVGKILNEYGENQLNGEWKDRITNSQKGARHTVAAAVASTYPEACVVIISENRGISVLYNGKPLVWNDIFE